MATPKQIRELMKVDGLTNDEVKSHLQVSNMELNCTCNLVLLLCLECQISFGNTLIHHHLLMRHGSGCWLISSMGTAIHGLSFCQFP